MSGLTDTDLRNLAASFITPELAALAKLHRITDERGAEIVHQRRKAGVSYAGIVFPYPLPPKFAYTQEYRLRRDEPEYHQRADGTLKSVRKYLGPPGARNMLYFPPGCHEAWLKDISLPIIITEGEKKCLALCRLVSEDLKRERWHFLPLAISGVYSWRGKICTTATATGGKVEVKGLITDFSYLELKNREVSILFDANVASNNSVRAARTRLANELKKLGAIVYVIDLPETEGINGIDDLLGLWERQEGTAAAIAKGLALMATKTDSSAVREKKRSQSAILMELAGNSEITYFHTSESKAFATLPVESHFETHEVRSKFFREWLSHRFWEVEDSIPSSQALEDALRALCGKAKYSGSQHKVFLRIAAYEDKVYLDLANEFWQVVAITQTGWRVVAAEDSPVKFRRPNGSLPLPLPVRNGNPHDLAHFINLVPESFPLVCAWLVACLRPGKPVPPLILSGEQGSAKSTTSKVLKRLIDPNLCDLRSQPRDERDLMISANNNWILAFDNLSKIPEWLSDAFCRLVTGGGFATRTLYENDEETLFSAMRPIILNGITELATKPDLLDRSLLPHCPNISKAKRLDEEEFWNEFERSHPTLLGAFLTALSETLANLPGVRLTERERMADFEKLGVAAEIPLGFAEGTFQRAYSANRREAHGVALDSSPTAIVVIAYMAERDSWKGTATVLLADLKKFADKDQTHGIRADDLPKLASALSGELKRIAPNLRENGIEFRRAKSGSRSISLDKEGNPSSGSSKAPVEAILVHPGPDDARALNAILDDNVDTELTFNTSKTVDLNVVDDPDDVFPRDSDTTPVETLRTANGRRYVICDCGKDAFVGQQCAYCHRENVGMHSISASP